MLWKPRGSAGRGWAHATHAPQLRAAGGRAVREPPHRCGLRAPSPQAYAQLYSGHGKIDRLLFVADKSGGKPLEVEALKMAAEELKKV